VSDRVISVVAAVIRDRQGHVLLVRKRGTAAFMQPGGKRGVGESDLAALSREVTEELGCRLLDGTAQALGTFDCAAANEPGYQVCAAVYAIEVEGAIEPAAEIDQLIWVDPLALPDLPIAPLTRDHVLPLARSL